MNNATQNISEGANDLIVDSQTDKVTGESSYGDNELTTNVGTALYVAPELRGQSSGNYNEKVDVSSNGWFMSV